MNEWISVEERLPDEVECFLVYWVPNDDEWECSISIGVWMEYCQEWDVPNLHHQYDGRVTHWMPLPEEPVDWKSRVYEQVNRKWPFREPQ